MTLCQICGGNTVIPLKRDGKRIGVITPMSRAHRSRQVGAREIAITPEMIEAGEMALSCSGSEELASAPLETTSRYAIEVFEAMARSGGYQTIVVRPRKRIARAS